MTENAPDRIIDTTDPRRYFATLPHLIRKLIPDIWTRDLYWYYIAEAGMHGGSTKRGTRRIASDCGMSVGQVSKSREWLGEHGLVLLSMYQSPNGPAYEVRPLNIMSVNVAFFDEKTMPESELLEWAREEVLRLAAAAAAELDSEIAGESVQGMNSTVHRVNMENKSRSPDGDLIAEDGAQVSFLDPNPVPAPASRKKPPTINTLRSNAFRETVTDLGIQAPTGGKDAIKETLDALAELDATPDDIREAILWSIGPDTSKRRAFWFREVPDTIRAWRNRPGRRLEAIREQQRPEEEDDGDGIRSIFD